MCLSSHSISQSCGHTPSPVFLASFSASFFRCCSKKAAITLAAALPGGPSCNGPCPKSKIQNPKSKTCCDVQPPPCLHQPHSPRARHALNAERRTRREKHRAADRPPLS